MTASLLISGNAMGSVITSGQTRYSALAMTCLDFEATEINRQIIHRTVGTIEVLAVRCSNHFRGAGTVTTRINGGSGTLTVSIPASTTGYFEDNSNADGIAAGDIMNYVSTCASSVGGTMTLTGIQVTFSPTDTTKTVVRYAIINGANMWSQLTNYYTFCCKEQNQIITETNSQFQFSSSVTLKNADIYLSTNSRGGADVRTRINAADGNIFINTPNIGTGYFSDLSNTDSVVDGDLGCISIEYGNIAAGSNTIINPWTAIDIESTDTSFYVIYGNPSTFSLAADPGYFTLSGSSSSDDATGVESNVQFDINLVRRASNLWVAIQGAAGSDFQVMFRKNAADTQLYVDVQAGSTGSAESQFSTELIATDDVSIRGSGAAFSIYAFGLRLTDNSTSAATVKIFGGQIFGGQIF